MLQRSNRAYRLGLDMGSNSIGWWVIWLRWNEQLKRYEPDAQGPGGVRIFPDGRDPQSKTSNAVGRRVARSARKRRDRFLQRQGDLINALVRYGLFPEDVAARKALETVDPYQLRRDALTGALPAHHVGRALFHLNQRRGFSSNRKAERGKDSEKGAIKQAEEQLETQMGEAKAPTMGAYFADRHLPKPLVDRQEAIRTELKKLGKDHLTGNARKKAWAKARKKLFGDAVLGPEAAPEGVRARAEMVGAKATYEFYPTRQLVEKEFTAIWTAQAPHHPAMTEAARAHIHHVIFHQRPLKDPIVGKCTLDPAKTSIDKDPDGYRTPWSHPLAQRFRIFQEARNLEVREAGQGSRRLTKDESDYIARALLAQKALAFDKMRSDLNLSSEARFNLESEKRKGLDGDQTAARLSDKKAFGKAWRGFPQEKQAEIIGRLLDTEDDSEIVGWLMAECGLDEAAATRVANMPLPDGHCRFGLRALRKIMPVLEGNFSDDGVSGIRLYDAAKLADPMYDVAKAPTGEILDYLPYYGDWLQDDVVGSAHVTDKKEKRFGQYPNPTVHIGLGQLRRVVNELIREYGAPAEIVIEFTRELKLSEQEKAEKQREQAGNQRRNEERKAKIREVFGDEYDPTPTDLLKMRLWEELAPGDGLDRKCPYTGHSISVRRLLSAEVDIDHILPFQMTLDDSAANKTVCLRDANRYKRKRTPFEAFGNSPSGYNWDDISARAALLPRNKRWRFDKDAREQFEAKGGFLARQLNETGWLARIAKKYLMAVTDPNAIWVVPGRLTSMIRGKWGLNALLPDHNYAGVRDRDESFTASTNDLEFSGVKNRADHRHHAIDGFVAAMTDRSLLWKMASAYDVDRDKIEIPTPWDKDKLRSDLKAALDAMVVSHKPDHGVQGKLHEDTAYGVLKVPETVEDKGKAVERHFVRRKLIEGLTPKEVVNIRDPKLRKDVLDFIVAKKADGVDPKTALLAFRDQANGPHTRLGLRRVRVLVAEDPAYTVGIASRRDGSVYKAYAAGENLYVDIIEDARGRWVGRAVTRFQANQPGSIPPAPEGRPVMRLFKGDLLAVDHRGVRTVVVVRQLRQSLTFLAPHNETGNLHARHGADNEIDPFRWLMPSYGSLKSMNAERVRVDELGRVWRLPPPGR